eukprot:1687299-Alexandrium_andersonii.AAC.1
MALERTDTPRSPRGRGSRPQGCRVRNARGAMGHVAQHPATHIAQLSSTKVPRTVRPVVRTSLLCRNRCSVSPQLLAGADSSLQLSLAVVIGRRYRR